jgi:hypothetical protein
MTGISDESRRKHLRSPHSHNAPRAITQSLTKDGGSAIDVAEKMTPWKLSKRLCAFHDNGTPFAACLRNRRRQRRCGIADIYPYTCISGTGNSGLHGGLFW